jgi:hypothetical protein
MQFNDTTNKTGMIQECERILFNADYGRISDDSENLATFTSHINKALDEVVNLMVLNQDRWQWSDWNNDIYETYNLVSGTRAYQLTNPEDVLFVYAVMVLQDAVQTEYRVIRPFDHTDQGTRGYLENDDTNAGVPVRYDKIGGSLYLDPTPNYNATDGLKVFSVRRPHKFETTDTTAEPAMPSTFAYLIPLIASSYYASDENTAIYNSIANRIFEKKNELRQYMTRRSQDDQPKLRPHIRRQG